MKGKWKEGRHAESLRLKFCSAMPGLHQALQLASIVLIVSAAIAYRRMSMPGKTPTVDVPILKQAKAEYAKLK